MRTRAETLRSERRVGGRRGGAAARCGIAVLLLSGCAALGPPPMEPLSAEALAAAEQRWQSLGVDSYRVVVRVRAPRFEAAVYDVRVADGEIAQITRNGQAVRREDAHRNDYSIPGLFDLLREDLGLAHVRRVGDMPPIDLRARFEKKSGRLVRYRRTVGTARRRVLLVEVLEYEPLEAARAGAAGAAGDRRLSSALRPPLGDGADEVGRAAA